MLPIFPPCRTAEQANGTEQAGPAGGGRWSGPGQQASLHRAKGKFLG
jgi:hypothetical protein